MKRARVSSSALTSVGYDAERRILEVEFVSTEVYRYFDVEPDEVEGLLDADSMGRYLNEHIKPAHPYVHLEDA